MKIISTVFLLTLLNISLSAQTSSYNYFFLIRIDDSDFIKTAAGYHSKEGFFLKALYEADSLNQKANDESISYITYFANAYKRYSKKPLNTIISLNSGAADSTIVRMLEEQYQKKVMQTAEIIKQRLFFYTGKESNVQVLGKSGKIRIEIKDSFNKDNIGFLINNSGALRFAEVLDISKVSVLLSQMDSLCVRRNLYLTGEIDGKPHSLLISGLTYSSGGTLTYLSRDRNKIHTILQHPKISAFYPDYDFYWYNHTINKENGDSDDLIFCYSSSAGDRQMIASKVDTAYVVRSQYDNNSFELNFTFNSSDSAKWAAFTEKMSYGRRQVAMLLDNYCFSAPTVASKIPGGKCVISGNFTSPEPLKVISALMRCNAYPCEIRFIEQGVIVKK